MDNRKKANFYRALARRESEKTRLAESQRDSAQHGYADMRRKLSHMEALFDELCGITPDNWHGRPVKTLLYEDFLRDQRVMRMRDWKTNTDYNLHEVVVKSRPDPLRQGLHVLVQHNASESRYFATDWAIASKGNEDFAKELAKLISIHLREHKNGQLGKSTRSSGSLTKTTGQSARRL